MALCALLVLQACEPESSPTAITRDEYIELYVEILRAASEERDALEASERAREILERRGYAPEDLNEFTRQHSDDPAYLANVWGQIEMRLREKPKPDSSDALERNPTGPSGDR